MKRRRHVAGMIVLLLGVVVLAAVGCAKQPEVGAVSPTGPTSSTTVAPPPATGSSERPPEVAVTQRPVPREDTLTGSQAGGSQGQGAGGSSPLSDIFFEYDKALLTDDARRILNEDAGWLKANVRATITLEGHCDERGTSEYNLGLGDRRAKAVRDYLVAAGIDGGRIRTISYGKERPFVPGHDESAWRQNRRVHFVVASR